MCPVPYFKPADQLVAGLSRNTADYGLIATMRDFSDLGATLRPGEALPPDQK